MIHEFLWIVDQKAAPMSLPRDDMGQAIDFDLLQHSVKLDGKRNGDAPASAMVVFVRLLLLLHVLLRVERVVMVVVHHKVTIEVLGGFAGLLRLASALGAQFLGEIRIDLGEYVGSRRNSTGGIHRCGDKRSQRLKVR